MAYGELYLPEMLKLERNPITGRFLKGHVPATKGKKWDEYMSKKMQKRASKGWKNLDLYRCKGGGGKGGRPKKAVVGIMDDGSFRVFSYTLLAAKWCGGNRHNVSRCCRQNMLGDNTNHKYMGRRFYFEEDGKWIEKIK